eukprot:1100339-Pelagomonas_calceolata.AAC.1
MPAAERDTPPWYKRLPPAAELRAYWLQCGSTFAGLQTIDVPVAELSGFYVAPPPPSQDGLQGTGQPVEICYRCKALNSKSVAGITNTCSCKGGAPPLSPK